jgi:hypothetical protein
MSKYEWRNQFEQDDNYDIPICDNCLKSLADPTHNVYRVIVKVATGPGPEDFEEAPRLVCKEPKRVECMGCGKVFTPEETTQEKDGNNIEYWCNQCFNESYLNKYHTIKQVNY